MTDTSAEDEMIERVRKQALEEAAKLLLTMKFTWDLMPPETGPFTREQRVVDAVTAQGAERIRAIAARPAAGERR
jgi:hypothetical protein